jgi:hypothetical protein
MAQIEDTRLPVSVREALVDDPKFLRDIKMVLQRCLEAESAEHLQADPHERTETRPGYRNGSRGRQLKTRVGTLQLLLDAGRLPTNAQDGKGMLERGHATKQTKDAAPPPEEVPSPTQSVRST